MASYAIRSEKIKGVGSLFLSVLHKTKTPDPFFSDPGEIGEVLVALSHFLRPFCPAGIPPSALPKR